MGSWDYDFGLLELATPVNMKNHPHIHQVVLPYPDFEPHNKVVKAVGWGNYMSKGKKMSLEVSPVLQKIDLKVLSEEECRREWDVTSRMFCAGRTGATTCYGDSGGPVLYMVEDQYVQV